MTQKNKWRALFSLPENIAGSSAAVLNNTLYNIGGDGSSHSVYWLELLSRKGRWNTIKTLGMTDLSGHYWRKATAVGNNIVYFG